MVANLEVGTNSCVVSSAVRGVARKLQYRLLWAFGTAYMRYTRAPDAYFQTLSGFPSPVCLQGSSLTVTGYREVRITLLLSFHWVCPQRFMLFHSLSWLRMSLIRARCFSRWVVDSQWRPRILLLTTPCRPSNRPLPFYLPGSGQS